VGESYNSIETAEINPGVYILYLQIGEQAGETKRVKLVKL
jgi:hypothetical protein